MSGKLYFKTPQIDIISGKEIIKVEQVEMNKLQIPIFVPTGDQRIDTLNMSQINALLEKNRDKLSKITLEYVLNQLFDLVEMKSRNDFTVYSDTLSNIRTAKEDSIELEKDHIEKLRAIFSEPPKNPKLNSTYSFVLECLDRTLSEALTPEKEKKA